MSIVALTSAVMSASRISSKTSPVASLSCCGWAPFTPAFNTLKIFSRQSVPLMSFVTTFLPRCFRISFQNALESFTVLSRELTRLDLKSRFLASIDCLYSFLEQLLSAYRTVHQFFENEQEVFLAISFSHGILYQTKPYHPVLYCPLFVFSSCMHLNS